MSASDVRAVLNSGIDFVSIGRAAILRHDFPLRVLEEPTFQSPELPVTEAHLKSEGLSPIFIQYMKRWKGFVVEEA